MPGAERGNIFISYRRDDARGASGRVFDWLRIGFGRERVFRDVASIGVGRWRCKIDQALADSIACVAVIGRRWADGTNLPRLQDPDDMVRHELETALACGDREELTLIPLLVEDAQLSQVPADQLPESLRPLLADWNVLVLTESGWDDDTRRLIDAIAVATGLPVNPELEEWLALMSGAQQGLIMLRRPEAAAPSALHGEEHALEGLLHRAAEAEPQERPSLKAALAALANGNTLLAESSFEQELANSRRLRLAAEQLALAERRRESDAARSVAGLAMVRGDLTKALLHLQMALEANPDNLDASLELGFAWISRGDLAQARGVLEALIQRAVALGDRRQEGRAWKGLGEVMALQGDGAAALVAYQSGLAIAESLVASDPINVHWQHDLVTSHHKIGDVLVLQGDGAAARMAYQSGLVIAVDLVRQDPANTEWLRDLSVSQEKIAAVQIAQGDGPGALLNYQASLSIREGLVAQDPANTRWQRDLSVSQERIGALKLGQGDGAGSLTAYRASLAIRERLVAQDPANTQWQRDLSVSQERIGTTMLAQGDPAAALTAYRASLAIRRSLILRDPSNTQWQRDLFVSQIKIGDVLSSQDDHAGSLVAYQAALDLAEALVRCDPANSQWQRDLFVSRIKIADGLYLQDDTAAALAAYQAALTIAAELVPRDPANVQWQMDLAMVCSKTAALLPLAGAQEVLHRGRDILLAQRSLTQDGAQEWIEWFDQAIRHLDGDP